MSSESDKKRKRATANSKKAEEREQREQVLGDALRLRGDLSVMAEHDLGFQAGIAANLKPSAVTGDELRLRARERSSLGAIEAAKKAETKIKAPRTSLGEFNHLFPGGIPDGISVFINHVMEKIATVLDHIEIPADVLSNIFSYVPKFSKKEYKVLLIGDGGVGKELFVDALKGIFKFDTSIDSQTYVNVVSLIMNTNYGAITFKIWSSHERFELDRISYGADCAILMYDFISRIPQVHLPSWYRIVTHHCGEDIPIVLCGGKAEIGDRKNWPRRQKFVHEKQNIIEDVEISYRNRNSCEKPFRLFAKQLIGERDPIAKIKFLPFSAPYERYKHIKTQHTISTW